jgi:3-deoxy-7-phosphoheptulonate synthase
MTHQIPTSIRELHIDTNDGIAAARADHSRSALKHTSTKPRMPDNALLALQQPEWPDAADVRSVRASLATADSPVDLWSCRALQRELALAAAGDGFVVMGGDCAELFDDCTPARVIEKADHLHRVGDRIETATGLRTTRIGRFGGQFAKPRSNAHEKLSDGRMVPSYRGDAVNGLATDQRQPDPGRLLLAHRRTRAAAQALLERDRKRRETTLGRRPEPSRTYLGHEALLLDYERALLRHGGRHASSAHYLWIGERTRHIDHAHVAFAASIDNPVGVKLGPSVDCADVRALTALLDPKHEHRPGRLSLIVRMGAAHCAMSLPPMIEALGPRARDVVWILDPMHGNGRTNAHGQKTRLLSDVMHELRVFVAVLAAHRLSPAGIHLEMTPDDVTECIAGPADLTARLPDYRSACDPRLNPRQVDAVAALLAELLCRPPTAIGRRLEGGHRAPSQPSTRATTSP